MEQMNVFISWSGETSKKLAKSLSEWIPTVIQAVKTFYSPDDIHKGELWSEKLGDQLKSNYTGILCITKDNQEAPWIMFEAGALTNSVGKGKVCPLLFDMEITDLKGPLTRYNATTFNKTDVKKMLISINNDLENKLDDKILDKMFEVMWPEFEKDIKNIISEYGKRDKSVKGELARPIEDMVREILELQREQRINLEKNSALLNETTGRSTEEILYQLKYVLSELRVYKNFFNYLSAESTIKSSLASEDAMVEFLNLFRRQGVSDAQFDKTIKSLTLISRKEVYPKLSSYAKKELTSSGVFTENGELTEKGFTYLKNLLR